jgi:hypothetical protein
MNFVVAPLPVLETDLFGRLLGLVAGLRQTLRRYPIPLEKELEWLNTERESVGLAKILPSWASSTCKLDYGKNRDIYWRCQHMCLHLEQYLDIFEVKCPEHNPIVVFDNSSGHGAYADDALQAQKMSSGWGGKQARMRDTSWKKVSWYYARTARTLIIRNVQD